MRRLTPTLLPALAVAALLAALWLWGLGGAEALARRAAEGQRGVQNALAGALRGLRAGEPGALLGLWTLCLAYGVLHAAGPGHGKLVIGGYGLGRRVAMRRLAGLAVASSLAQAATAVALVGFGVLALGLTREEMQGLADGGLVALSALMVAGVGGWLAWRGARALWRLRASEATHPHIHDSRDGHGAACASCGHAHGPTSEEAARVGSGREAAALVLAVAARPCTGALFLLILTWRMGIFGAGVVGAFVMALGTAAVTVAVAAGSVALREGALMRFASGPALARALGAAELAAGVLVVAVALQLLRQAA